MNKTKPNLSGIPEAPTFYPTPEEFSDALGYISQLVNHQNAKKFGIVKIVPPSDFTLSRFANLRDVSVTPRIQNLCELSVKNKSTMFSKEQRVLGAQNNKRRKLNWRAIVCEVCHSAGSDEKLLLCDYCDAAYHTFCLTPVLPNVPRGSWFCPPCRNSRMSGGHGFEHMNEKFSLETFAERANRFKRNYFHKPPKRVALEDVEEEFWRLVSCSPYDDDSKVVVEYGADLSGVTGFYQSNKRGESDDDADQDIDEGPYSSWNLNKLPVQRDSALRFVDGDISGMKSPWCYAGSCFSCFCWHVEDHWTYSINYNHHGEPKTWYGISADDALKFEKALRLEAPSFFDRFPTLMHNLNTMFDPRDAVKRGVPVCRAHQQEGEFIITFPRAYHAGFNQGFNFAEAVNFCPADWLWMGRKCIDTYRIVGRPCVFSHIELCAKMAERCDDLSITLLRGLAKEMSDIINGINNDLFVKAKQLGFDANAVRVFKGIAKLGDEERSCYKCKTALYEVWASCVCKKGKLSCIHHVSTLCQCAIDNRRKKVEMSHSLEDWKELYDNVCNALKRYKKWLSDVRHINMLYNKSAHELGFPPITTSKSQFHVPKEMKNIPFDDLSEEIEEMPSCEQPPHLEVEAEPSNEIPVEALECPISPLIKEDMEDSISELDGDEITFSNGNDLPQKFSRADLVQYQLQGAIALYPLYDRRSLDIVLEKFDSVNKCASQLLNCDPQTIDIHDKLDIQDFMFLLHQMRILPFDFEVMQHRLESLGQEVETSQHNVFQLETRVTKVKNSFLYVSGGRFVGPADYNAMAPFTNILNEMQTLLNSIRGLPVKINGMLLLEDEMRTFDWLDRVRQLLLKASQSVLYLSELEDLIQMGSSLPSKDVIAQYMSLLNNRLQEGMQISKQASDIINLTKEKIVIEKANFVHREANRLNITCPTIEELRSLMLTARKVQQRLDQSHITLDNVDTCGKLKLHDLISLVDEANKLPFRFKGLNEFQNLLTGAYSFLQQVTALFLGGSANLTSNVEDDCSLLKVILPRPESAIHRLQQGSFSLREKKKKISLRRLVTTVIHVEELANVEHFKEEFLHRRGDSRLRNLYQDFAAREKQAMLQLRSYNKRKSENDDADDESNASYCLCSQPYDSNSDMVECELCAEWYHYKCLSIPSLPVTSGDGKSNVPTIQSFLCPLCERSQRPDCETVLDLLSVQNSSHRQLNMMESIALQELLERVYNFRDKIKRSFDRQFHQLSQAWSECLKLFGIRSIVSSTLNMDKKPGPVPNSFSNRKQSLKSAPVLSSNDDIESCKSYATSTNESRIKVMKGRERWSFKAQDLKRVKCCCTVWVTNSSLCEPIMAEMEEYVVEGSLLEITCNEAKALSLLYQIIHSIMNEAEHENEDKNSHAPSLRDSDEDDAFDNYLPEKWTHHKRKESVARSDTASLVSSGRGRKPKPSEAYSKAQLADQRKRKKGERGRGARPGIKRLKAEKNIPSMNDRDRLHAFHDNESCSSKRTTTNILVDIKNENESSITSNHPLSDKQSPSSVDSRDIYLVSSQTISPVLSDKKTGKNVGQRSRRKKNGYQSSMKSEKNSYDSSSAAEDVEEECALGHACIIHNKKRIRNVSWIQCDDCTKWYHYFCVGIRSANSEEYICPTCVKVKSEDTIDELSVQHIHSQNPEEFSKPERLSSLDSVQESAPFTL